MSLITHGSAPMPQEYFTWQLVREFHWTPDQIRSLSMRDLHDYLQIRDAQVKAGKT